MTVTASRRTKSYLMGASVAGLCSLPLLAATAFAADEQPAVLEEVTVTAEKRGEQSTQDVPGAIQAISGAALQRAGAQEFADLAVQVPSLSYQDLGPGDKKYVIRGITSTGPAT